MVAASLSDRLRLEIERSGPVSVSRWIEAALYDPDDGFYMGTGQAGRRGDFLTAPEVGPLFGAVVARAIDLWWHQLGRPDPYVVFEWGAGPGTLARSVLAAEPAVLEAGALRWCAIELSPEQRAQHPEHRAVFTAPTVDAACVAAGIGDRPVSGLVLANELIDNLPFDTYEMTADGWREVLIGVNPEPGPARFVAAPGTHSDSVVMATLERLAPNAAVGSRVPWLTAGRRWLGEACGLLSAGRVVVFDYGDTTAVLADRGGWLRTHRSHDDSGDWLAEPGTRDITTDVPTDQLQLDQRAAQECSQAEFLRDYGIEELVDEGRRIWEATAAIGDLAALRARSRIREAEALLEPTGMGGFRVLAWTIPPHDGPTP